MTYKLWNYVYMHTASPQLWKWKCDQITSNDGFYHLEYNYSYDNENY